MGDIGIFRETRPNAPESFERCRSPEPSDAFPESVRKIWVQFISNLFIDEERKRRTLATIFSTRFRVRRAGTRAVTLLPHARPVSICP